MRLNDLIINGILNSEWSDAHGKRNSNFISNMRPELTIPTQEHDLGAIKNRTMKMPTLCSTVIKRLDEI